MAALDSAVKATQRSTPKWTIASKPDFVVGGAVPSWQKSIPGPKYTYNLDVAKEKGPVYSMRKKPDMVIGGNVPSWTNSIPGPKYLYPVDPVKPRQPVFSILGRGEDKKDDQKLARPASAPSIPSASDLDDAFNATKAKPPKFSISSKPEMVIGGPVPSWQKSIPGPKYTYSTDVHKKKTPSFTIGKKLPTESDMMKVRSPGPTRYGGSAIDAKKQSECDSTRSRTFSTSFGIGPRWSGLEYQLSLSGALGRYDTPMNRRI